MVLEHSAHADSSIAPVALCGFVTVAVTVKNKKGRPNGLPSKSANNKKAALQGRLTRKNFFWEILHRHGPVTVILFCQLISPDAREPDEGTQGHHRHGLPSGR